MRVKLPFYIASFLLLTNFGASAQNVIEDGGVGMNREEVEFIVKYWPEQMQRAAANDAGDRLELLNMAMVTKKLAAEIDRVLEEVDSDTYWKYQYAMRNKQRELVFKQFMRTVQVPDMSKLAAERYKTEKDNYASVPEERTSSHILLECRQGSCDASETRTLAEKIHAELLEGANFEEYVLKYSNDPGSSKNKGKFDKWLKKGEPHVSPPYVGGVYAIEKVGGYSEVVVSQFGFHIIRLDEIRESYYKPFEEVKDNIVASLVNEYLKLAAKEYEDRYRFSDEAKIDATVLDEIFAKYRTPALPSVTEPKKRAPQVKAVK